MTKPQESSSFTEEQSRMSKQTFTMFLPGVGVITGLSVVLSLYEKSPVVLVLLYGLLSVLSFLFYLYVTHKEDCRVASALFLVLTECVLLPVLFVLEGGMFGPIPIWVTVNIMYLFLFFSGKLLYLLFAGVILEYGYLFSRVYRYPHLSGVPTGRGETFLDYLFCFLSAVFWLGLILYTQKKTYEKENLAIDRSNEIIREAGMQRNRFFSDIAQEMRIPVNSILAVTELLLKEEPDPALRAEIMNIRSASYDMLSVIDDALIYSGLEAGSIRPDNRPYYFAALLKNIIDAAADEMAERHIAFLVLADPRIPRQLYGDRRKIRQIFSHLLAASLAMTREGRIMLQIGYENGPDPEEVTFRCAVSDTGKGVYPTALEETQELVTAGDFPDSAGLKFHVSREYLKLMDGTMETKTLENVGMTTSFTFKNRVLHAAPMAQVKGCPLPRVLIYVGNHFYRENWQFVMEGLGVEACYVSGRHRFESEIRDVRYDAVFISKKDYRELVSLIAFYRCEENTYVVAETEDIYEDFGKCRLIRRPLSCLNLAAVLNGEWKKEDYLTACHRESFSARGSRILVIDDNTVNLRVAAGIFARYLVDIDIAASGEEGLNKMERENYDLIFLDLLMPEMDGVTVLSNIRQGENAHYRTAPVVAISSSQEEDMREYALKKGFQGFLEKPIKGRNIEECMLAFLPERLIVYNREKKKPESRKEEFAQEERGLQVRKGLANIGYNEDAYAAILNTYYRENLKKLSALSEVFRKEELSVFVSAVHGIKSTSASIGAMGLSALARELEYAGKDGERGFISEKLPLFLKEYELILEEIKTYLTEHGKMEAAEEISAPGTEEVPLPMERLQTLKEKLDRMDLKACSGLLEELAAANYGEENNAALLRLKEAYGRFDFHLAKKELQQLLKS